MARVIAPDPAAAGASRAVARIAYAGEPGAFAEDAVLAFFGAESPRSNVAGFREVFESVESGATVAGVVPIENLVNGSVREVYDLLLEHDLEVIGEVVVAVRLCLAALPGQSLDDIDRVYSHIQALGQAEAFLRSRRWSTMTTYNTAGAGKLIADGGERRAAAVLSPRAAAVFGLEILADDIQSVGDNRTRFVVIARPGGDAGPRTGLPRPPLSSDAAAPGSPQRPMRTTVAFAVRNEPGTLLAALRAFAERGVNLSKLESRPSRTAAWEYVFWTDVDADAADPACAAALDDLRTVSTMVRVFGSYPRAEAG